jgi:hypothetical protein
VLVRALRGVCVGPEVNKVVGDEFDIRDDDAAFLTQIGAVELVVPPPPAVVQADVPPIVENGSETNGEPHG